MAEPDQKGSTMEEIAQLVAPLTAVEHDHVVLALTKYWGMADLRQPWDRAKVVTKERLDKIKQIESRVFELAETLTGNERDDLIEDLKLIWLRRAIQEAEESLEKDGGIPAEEVFAKLRQRAQARLLMYGR